MVSHEEADLARDSSEARVETAHLPGPGGWAWVSQGVFYFKDPDPGGRGAMVRSGEHVTLLVGGRETKGPVEVKGRVAIEVRPERSEPQASAQVRISKDKLTAYLRVDYQSGKVYRLADRPPARELTLEAVLAEEVVPTPFTVEALLARLHEAGVKYGISQEALQRAAQGTEDQEIEVAHGEPPQPGQDGSIEWLVTAGSSLPQSAEELDRVDLSRYREIAGVRPEQILARRVPPVPGIPGRDVTGASVAPPPVKDVTIKAGPGVDLKESGNVAVATTAGRAELRGTVVAVYPTYAVEGDADAKTGHIRFQGDVTIKGNVLDGMRIEAGGKVDIKGYAATATILAGGNISIAQNALGCQIRAGGPQTAAQKLQGILSETHSQVRNLLVAAHTVLQKVPEASGAEVTPQMETNVLRVLLENKFINLRRQIGSWRNEAEKLQGQMAEVLGSEEGKLIGETLAVLKSLASYLSPEGTLRLKGLERLEHEFNLLSTQVERLAPILTAIGAQRSNVTAGYVQNCRIEASGDVKVVGKGCFNSSIFAGGRVSIEGTPGIFAGGEIVARGNVKIRQIGTPAETYASVQVPDGCRISAGTVFPGVYLKAGHRQEKITVRQDKVEFRA